MLGLKLPTDPRWADMVNKSIEFVLTDHAYCEQKAASTCISLIQAYPTHERLVDELAPIVTEEWGHFRMVLKEIKKRNLTLGKQRKDEYVHALMDFMKATKGSSPEAHLMDKLLMAALIEARSCERFKMLWKHIDDKDLSEFYYKLMVAEANHYKLFIDLAKTYSDPSRVKERWEEWLTYEADVLRNYELSGKTVH
ncbi:MAG: tRNA-(ms[2]io[6]A)-hydroxylase [Saprospiraceae bacterium]|nr:tRNA-(ms[2]io[6]A)-hydroxylase [Saprospiraceae bacterium]